MVGESPSEIVLPPERWVGKGRARALLSDAVPALLLAAFVCAMTSLSRAGEGAAAQLDAAAYLLCAVSGLAFALRRRFPVPVYLMALACMAAFGVLYGSGPIFLSALVALLWLVACRPRRVWGPLAAFGAVIIVVSRIPTDESSFPSLIAAAVWIGAALLVGEVVRLRLAETTQAQARAELAERQREEATLRRMTEERLRLAREVHDVVGHGLATITLHAGVAEHLLATHPEEAQRSIKAVREVSKTALEELRSEIEALREGDEDETAPRRPTLGLEAIPRLGDSMREAGIDVAFDVRLGDGPDLTNTVQAAAYRIVQEALTNVARHAGPSAHADVRLACNATGMELEVVDDGRGAPAESTDGNGLTGMRERAAALGGRLEAGEAPGGGFRVWARLPAEAA